MNTIFYELDAWMISVILAVLLGCAWCAGLWIGARARARGDQTGMGKVGDASLALMGLLLGFTFAVALQKHEQRRVAVVNDANSIGDFYTAASMLKEPVRTELCLQIRDYAEHRFALAQGRLPREKREAALGEIAQMHGKMTDLVKRALDAGDTTVATPLVNTLNGVTSNHATRLAALRDLLPGSVVLLLCIVAMTSLALLGRQEALEQRRHVRTAVMFVVLIVCCVYVTLDLNQPQRGMIQISQEPMERLIASMK